jgi:hypothetical protein
MQDNHLHQIQILTHGKDINAKIKCAAEIANNPKSSKGLMNGNQNGETRAITYGLRHIAVIRGIIQNHGLNPIAERCTVQNRFL